MDGQNRILIVFLVAACWATAVSAIGVKGLLSGRIGSSSPDQSSNAVRALPGYRQPLPSQHYSGYITVDEARGRRLFYYLVLSEVPSDVLLLWLTGGPGCSSMDAFTYEHGPLTFSFRPGADAGGRTPTLSDIQLHPNPASWSKAASVLYLDSPAGTGFSYSDDTPDYATDDGRTIDDLEVFVRRFFEQYKQLRQLQLYIAGESYGGVYVPLLTQRLLQHNRRLSAADDSGSSSSGSSSSGGSSSSPPYNLAGYIVGNAVTDDAVDSRGQVEFAYGAGLVDPDTYEATRSICEAHRWDTSEGSPCGNAMDRLEQRMGPVNQYDILGQCFFHDDNSWQQAAVAAAATRHVSRRTWPHAPAFPRANASRPIINWYAAAKHASASSGSRTGSGGSSSSSSGLLGHTISCADRRHALIYYNAPAVRAAIHAGSLEQAGRWEPCSDVLNYTHTSGSMIAVHRHLVSAGLRALVLSGTADYIVPFTGSRAWVYGLGLTPSNDWHAWSMPGSGQVSGHAVAFEGGGQGSLTFATVKGGGHMVPQTKPAEALALLQLWLARKL